MNSTSDVWKQVAAETGGKYKYFGYPNGVADQVTLAAEPWHILLNSVNIGYGGSTTELTVVGATYVTTGNLRFTINRASVFTRLGKLLGMQDIHISDLAFDADFVVKDELYFQVHGIIRDVDRLRELLNLFVETLNRLVAIGAATTQDPEGPFTPPSAEELASSISGSTGL